MADYVALFCRQVRQRSSDHREAVQRLSGLHGQIVSILREELDSMVRVIYLLSISDRKRRSQLIEASAQGQKWRHADGKRPITDREMVDLADRLQHWARSVYLFGCGFIHLSSFHDYRQRDPMDMISEAERTAILEHMRRHHGGPVSDHPSFQEIVPYLPAVFEKIAGNLECYVKELEEDRDLDD
ncbi:MAG: hypothetical protein ACYSU0_12940 [Planctomycetota bacterium]